MKRIALTLASLAGFVMLVVTQLASSSPIGTAFISIAAPTVSATVTIHQADESEPVTNEPFPVRSNQHLSDILVVESALYH